MKISMFGTGYVGLTTGTCLAELGNEVICYDIDEKKINNLKKGIIPIYEPGLKEMLEKNVQAERLMFSTDPKDSIERSDVIYICVGTPQDDQGKADLKYVFAVAQTIGKYINKYKIVVDKSTVPVGTAKKIKEIIKKETEHEFDVVSNPEFLREGSAIKDFMSPDRVIIGAENDKAKETITKIYKGLERTGKPILITDINSAEMIKYAANAMLATRISFMNQLSHLCEKVGADIKVVANGMGLDERIGPRFLQAGVGYGGSCFPKDVRALINSLKENNCDYDLFESVDKINEKQKISLIPKIVNILEGNVSNKKIAVWGLAFKPRTDDIREAPSIAIINELIKLGAKIKAFDPVAKENAKKILDEIEFGENPYKTVEGCDCLVVITEWNEFRYLDKSKIKSLMKHPNIIDGRNMYDPIEMKEKGFNYISIGRGN